MEKEGKAGLGTKAQGYIRSWLVQDVGRNSVGYSMRLDRVIWINTLEEYTVLK